jgi:hypothetical protein
MRKALRQFIDKSLDENDGIRREFYELRSKRVPHGENVSVLPRARSWGKTTQRKETANHKKETPRQDT